MGGSATTEGFIEKINEVYRAFIGQLTVGSGVVEDHALSLMTILIALELTFLGFWWAIEGKGVAGEFIKKLLMFTFFMWLIQNFSEFSQSIVQSFIQIGAEAGKDSSAAALINNPASILTRGIEVIKPICAAASNQAWYEGGIWDSVIGLASTLTIMVAYIIITLQVLLTQIEFHIIGTLAVILLPFSTLKHTKWISEAVFKALLSFGVKLMVLSFVLSITFPVLKKVVFPPDKGPSDPEMLACLGVTMILAIIIVKAPATAAGLLSGSPSLSGAGAAMGAVAVGAGALRAASMAAPMVAGAAGASKNGISTLMGKMGGGPIGGAPSGGGGSSSAAGGAGEGASVPGLKSSGVGGGAGGGDNSSKQTGGGQENAGGSSSGQGQPGGGSKGNESQKGQSLNLENKESSGASAGGDSEDKGASSNKREEQSLPENKGISKGNDSEDGQEQTGGGAEKGGSELLNKLEKSRMENSSQKLEHKTQGSADNSFDGTYSSSNRKDDFNPGNYQSLEGLNLSSLSPEEIRNRAPVAGEQGHAKRTHSE